MVGSNPKNGSKSKFEISSIEWERGSSEQDTSNENVTVTVRFRPLSRREISQGEEIAWYAEGDNIVRNETTTSSTSYLYDRVFGPTTTTHNVYDIAAQHLVTSFMHGVNGTIFVYGVTSSGKTHTMHGDQRSPGIIPLAVKDVFSIIQETPSREFLLRVSYLEIYNEVVNDLLNPSRNNLRIREDVQSTFVEGIKEEVVLSAAHALSLLAAGEEHRHVGSTDFNVLSSRSHTIFTLTIESSPCGECYEGEVNFSQLNLIDLAGSESSKAETTGMQKKEGSYINKSLLTLGTVISKMTDGRASFVPYSDSKLTQLLQSSLSGHGSVSLICTVTPSSSNTEETHNTLRFANRAKNIKIQAAQNKIIDEKSLIKKYQNEICSLQGKLEQIKQGFVADSQMKDNRGNDFVLLKQKLEDGQVKLQSRFEQEEEAKAALLGRIQRLTKLILVSTKTPQSQKLPQHSGPKRRHSFGEEELAYLPYKKRDLFLDNEYTDLCDSPESNIETTDDTVREKKSRRHGLLNWLKPRKLDIILGILRSISNKSSEAKSTSIPSTPQADNINFHTESRYYNSLPMEGSPPSDLLSESRQDTDFLPHDILGHVTPKTRMKTFDQIDLLREQKISLSGEVELHTSAVRRLSEEAAKNPAKEQNDMIKLHGEIKGKNAQKSLLKNQIADSIIALHDQMDKFEISQSIAELVGQLNEKAFELEVKTADNRIIQEQLGQKICECEELQDMMASFKQQLSDTLELRKFDHRQFYTESQGRPEKQNMSSKDAVEEVGVQTQVLYLPPNTASYPCTYSLDVEELMKRVDEITLKNQELEGRNYKLEEECSYARRLTSSAAVELKALSDEVIKLMKHNYALSSELQSFKSNNPARTGCKESYPKSQDPCGSRSTSDLRKHVAWSRERENAYEDALWEKGQSEAELRRKLNESKEREAFLENELTNMWVLIAKLDHVL